MAEAGRHPLTTFRAIFESKWHQPRVRWSFVAIGIDTLVAALTVHRVRAGVFLFSLVALLVLSSPAAQALQIRDDRGVVIEGAKAAVAVPRRGSHSDWRSPQIRTYPQIFLVRVFF